MTSPPADARAGEPVAAPGVPRPPARWTFLRRVVQWLVTLSLVAILVRLVDVGEVVRLLLSTNLALVLAALGVGLADRAMMIGKWYPMLRTQVSSIPLVTAARAYLAAGFVSMVLPGSVGSDVIRALALGRGRQATAEVGASIAVERLMGIAALGLLSLLAVAIALRQSVGLEFLLPWIVLLAGAAMVAIVLPFSSRVTSWLRRSTGGRVSFIRRFGSAYALYGDRPRLLTVVGVLSLVEQLFPIAVLWVLSRALGASVDITMLIVATPLATFAARLPITIAGFGVGEGALVYLLGLFGVPASEALALAVAARVIELGSHVPGAFFWADLASSARAAKTPPGVADGNAVHP